MLLASDAFVIAQTRPRPGVFGLDLAVKLVCVLAVLSLLHARRAKALEELWSGLLLNGAFSGATEVALLDGVRRHKATGEVLGQVVLSMEGMLSFGCAKHAAARSVARRAVLVGALAVAAYAASAEVKRSGNETFPPLAGLCADNAAFFAAFGSLALAFHGVRIWTMDETATLLRVREEARARLLSHLRLVPGRRRLLSERLHHFLLDLERHLEGASSRRASGGAAPAAAPSAGGAPFSAEAEAEARELFLRLRTTGVGEAEADARLNALQLALAAEAASGEVGKECAPSPELDALFEDVRAKTLERRLPARVYERVNHTLALMTVIGSARANGAELRAAADRLSGGALPAEGDDASRIRRRLQIVSAALPELKSRVTTVLHRLAAMSQTMSEEALEETLRAYEGLEPLAALRAASSARATGAAAPEHSPEGVRKRHRGVVASIEEALRDAMDEAKGCAAAVQDSLERGGSAFGLDESAPPRGARLLLAAGVAVLATAVASALVVPRGAGERSGAIAQCTLAAASFLIVTAARSAELPVAVERALEYAALGAGFCVACASRGAGRRPPSPLRQALGAGLAVAVVSTFLGARQEMLTLRKVTARVVDSFAGKFSSRLDEFQKLELRSQLLEERASPAPPDDPLGLVTGLLALALAGWATFGRGRREDGAEKSVLCAAFGAALLELTYVDSFACMETAVASNVTGTLLVHALRTRSTGVSLDKQAVLRSLTRDAAGRD